MPRSPQRQSQNTLFPPARISFSASAQNGVVFASSAPTCSTYSCQLFSISSLKSWGSVPSRSPCWRFSGWYTTRSDTSARASRRAFCLGSWTMNGFTGRSGPVMRWPGAAPAGAAGAAGVAGARGAGGGAGAARGSGAAGGAAGRIAGAAGAAAGAGGGGAAGTVRGAAGGAARGGAGAGAGGAGATGGGFGVAGAGAIGGVAMEAFTGNTLLHTAQRARTPPAGTLLGSTRYTVSHDGQVTFI